MKANYHTHTHFCGHASGNSMDYARKAIENGFQVLGISDHAPHDGVSDYRVRMRMDQFDRYVSDIDDAIRQTQGQLTIYKGIEVEYWDNHEEYYSKLMDNLDYMIHGQHYVIEHNDLTHLISSFALQTVKQIHLYADFMIKAMRSRRFLFHAHPDLYLCGYQKWDKHAEEVAHKILKVAQEEGSVFEFNANGYRRGTVQTSYGIQPLYPRKEFWDLVKSYNIKTILSSDCHTPELLYDDTMKRVEEVYTKEGYNDIGIIHISNQRQSE